MSSDVGRWIDEVEAVRERYKSEQLTVSRYERLYRRLLGRNAPSVTERSLERIARFDADLRRIRPPRLADRSY